MHNLITSKINSASAEDVRKLYKIFLRREPENEEVVNARIGVRLADLLVQILSSEEFRIRIFEPVLSISMSAMRIFSDPVDCDIRDWILKFLEIDGNYSDIWNDVQSWGELSQIVYARIPLAEIFSDYISGESHKKFIENFSYFVDPRLDVIAGSELFDEAIYSREVQQTFSGRREAARHYLDAGWREGHNASSGFDARYYIATNPDVRDAGCPPLLHFIQDGQFESRRPSLSRSPRAAMPEAPAREQWRAISAAMKVEGRLHEQACLVATIDVIIPVYRGFDDTLACIYSVLTASNDTNYNLIVIDDCSPDAALSEELGWLHRLGVITLLRNKVNLGFVGTVNRGIKLNRSNDVILLNSDTIVYSNWIDRLKFHVDSNENVATVTPLSNNATIFSYPHFAQNNNQSLDFDKIDEITSSVNYQECSVVPTGVGFCFYITRKSLDALGCFNEQLFGRGYGEENDFCMRAIEGGMVNIAAHDVFVRHTGEVSFAETSSAGKSLGQARLGAVHPRYEKVVGEYVRRDPLRAPRERIDIERFARASRQNGILFISHHWGGGIQRHIDDLAGMLEAEGAPVLLATSKPDSTKYGLSCPTSDDYPNLPILDWADHEAVRCTLRDLGITSIHIHSLVGTPYQDIPVVMRTIRAVGVPYAFTAHDYAALCPRLTMMDQGDTYCGSTSLQYCGLCVAQNGSPFGVVDIKKWRETYRQVLSDAERIIVPSEDVARRFHELGRWKYNYLVRPHPLPTDIKITPAPVETSAVLIVGLIGAIGPHKGSRIIRSMMGDAISRKLPIRYRIYGYTDDLSDKDVFKNLEMIPYNDQNFRNVFQNKPCDITLFLSVCPETFCYTLDYSFEMGIYPISFDIGAIADRIRNVGFGSVMPNSYMFDPARINDFILNFDRNVPESIPCEERAWKSRKYYYAVNEVTE